MTCSITGLSVELILRIIDLIPPAAHLNFACTCKHIATCSSNVLQRHRKAYKQYRAASDLDPATVPILLRSALGLDDPIPAWHVRSLEVWRDRTSWEEWKTYSFLTPIHDDPESNNFLRKLQDDEVVDCLDTLGHRRNGAEYETARTQAESGHDGILKTLLLAHCPRIENLKFITQMHDEGSCLHWLKTIISNCISSTSESFPGIVWPLGLASLRDVAIGVPSDTWMDNRSRDPSWHIFVHLLRLPNITSIYYKDLCGDWDDGYEYAEDIPPRCSSVEHLFLDNCDGEPMPWNLGEALYRAPRSLLTASFRSGDARLEHADQFVNGFSEEQHSLKSLMFYDFGRDSGQTIHGYRCAAYQPDQIHVSCPLGQVSMNVQDIELFGFYWAKLSEDGESDEEAYVRHAAECFPMTMECLILWDETGSGYAGDKPNETRLIERAVIKIIEDGNYPGLKAIYLEEIEHRRSQRDARTELCFQDAIAAGKRHGVDVHTLTNRNELLHEISFPEAPDNYALETGPDWRKRPDTWVFNPYVGRRVPPGCAKCGCCESCKAEYPEELWESIRDM